MTKLFRRAGLRDRAPARHHPGLSRVPRRLPELRSGEARSRHSGGPARSRVLAAHARREYAARLLDVPARLSEGTACRRCAPAAGDSLRPTGAAGRFRADGVRRSAAAAAGRALLRGSALLRLLRFRAAAAPAADLLRLRRQRRVARPAPAAAARRGRLPAGDRNRDPPDRRRSRLSRPRTSSSRSRRTGAARRAAIRAAAARAAAAARKHQADRSASAPPDRRGAEEARSSSRFPPFGRPPHGGGPQPGATPPPPGSQPVP